MNRNWVLTIGINNYRNLQALRYAKQDAEALQRFFLQDIACLPEQIYHFSDDAPAIAQDYGPSLDACPTYATLRRFLRVRFEHPFLGAGDNFWFFFAGHGCRYEDRDYLLPIDGDPGDIPGTALPLHYITERLQRCGADNVILLIDACRSTRDSSRHGLGVGQEPQPGVITLFSCSPQEASYEIDELGHGAFTQALLESLALRGEGNCATVERLYHRLSYRVPQLNQQYGKPPQTPHGRIEPPLKNCLILLPRQASLADVKALKFSAAQAEIKGNHTLSKQFWIRVLAASPADPDAIEGIERLAQLALQPVESAIVRTQPSLTVADRSGDGTILALPTPKSAATLPLSQLPEVTFERITLDAHGQPVAYHTGQAPQWCEDLGAGVALEMMAIPAGSFIAGPWCEQTCVAPFLMGQYPITQAQWRAVAMMPPVDRPLPLQPSAFVGMDHPVEQVSWYEAMEFCQRLRRHSQRPYDLPTEIQWEYACRGGSHTPFHFGPTLTTAVANYRGTDSAFGSGSYGQGPPGIYRQHTTPVTQFAFTNGFGLYDMHGNVWEWCKDPWQKPVDPLDKSGDWLAPPPKPVPDLHSPRVVRGGAWFFSPRHCRSRYRNRGRPDYRLNSIGFRVICPLPHPQADGGLNPGAVASELDDRGRAHWRVS
jgi:formylglycine-generating enzyme required for sulfatase activity/uncharacterized caspase-like protein